MAVLDRALAINPDYAEAHCNRGFAFVSLGKIDRSLECFQTALRLRADYPEAYQGIARRAARSLRSRQSRGGGAESAGA